MSIKLEEYNVELAKKKDLTKNVYSAIFSKPEGFNFIAGQYVQFLIPQENKLVPKSFSIVSTPDKEYLEFCIKKYPGGIASEHIYDLNNGAKIKIRGPLGRFYLNNSLDSHNFIATGVGIAPIMSMIEEKIRQDETAKMNLLFGLRHEKDIFWSEKLKNIENNHKNFSYQITLSQPKSDWSKLTGRVTKHLDKLKKQANFYICGNRSMVKDVKNKLSKKVSQEKLHFEIF